MQIFHNPARAQWPALQQRPLAGSNDAILARAGEIFDDVARRGDDALRDYAAQLDGVPALVDLRVSAGELAAGAAQVPAELQAAIRQAIKNITTFHAAQQPPAVEAEVETMPGVRCWRRSVAVPRVGLYVPGGSAPLFSTLLMLGIPAKLAGCREIVLCTPPGRGDGRIAPAILFAAQELGLTTIVKAGGAQAVAALTVGTASVPAVDKIFGPGNRYVTAAKQLAAQRGVAIDMPAGPSEVLVIADASANPAFVAADLLSQAEHGPDSQVILLTDSEVLLNGVVTELERQLPLLPRAEIARQALTESRGLLLPDMATMLEFSNEYAPEHLILAVAAPEELAAAIYNAGSVFMGHLTPEAVGDYASGTNHTLPTGGYARAYSGVSLDSFYKKITFQQLAPAGLLALAPVVEPMAQAEGLHAHAHAVALRREALSQM
ncbi:histidinol dehydrogenase [Hymenobacter psoromatis]|uniref:histidinol dehydrogenase n=1 Tax=Hymenobacter psoromatis TaxID=1484116 RepID=UPI001CBD5A3D|nr:histidinol dehydrogenase [Hymenobacter psoromatis]